MFHFCSHAFVQCNGIVPVQLHAQCNLTFPYNQNCNQLYSAHRMILATLLECCPHDSGSSFIVILCFDVEAAFFEPVQIVDL